MDFEKQLKDDQAVVEVALEAFVRQFPSPEALGEAMGYSLLSGGKRIRPILVLEEPAPRPCRSPARWR